jgi:predicted nuclease of restriction endonuclease-like (RecB) superfamily
MLYERTALRRKSEENINKELKMLQDTKAISPDLVFRDPIS